MKKVFLLIAVAAFAFACGNNAATQAEGCTAKTECASHVDGEECAKKAERRCSKDENKVCTKKEGEGCCSKKEGKEGCEKKCAEKKECSKK